jgi:hypothetical protein
MVGIWNKIKNGLTTLSNKVQKNLIPFVGKLGDFINSKSVQGIASFVSPALTAFNPALGAAVSTGMNFLGKLGNTVNEYTKQNSVFSKRPDQLHERIQLKALPPPASEEDDEGDDGDDDTTTNEGYTGPVVEELD